MATTALKTRPTAADVDNFIDSLTDEEQRDDSRTLVKLMSKATKAEPRLWGPGIVGFGTTTMKYASGREVEWMRCGFSPRKGKLSIYLTCDIAKHAPLLKKLGKHTTGVGCLYVKRLADVDGKALAALLQAALKDAKGWSA
ncbi:MAG: DUF1801 domain-containing protein [Flavobacteriales bacterium]|nr:DUF1801 domain-containing protein [Flavobacteriales bacterium]